jgi:hypothetical protein
VLPALGVGLHRIADVARQPGCDVVIVRREPRVGDVQLRQAD